jgi:hypothetical protein
MDAYNYLSSRAQAIIGGTIPESVFSLVVMNFDQTVEKIVFQIPPENITENKTADYASESVLGRFEPIRMYTHSSSTKLNFTVSYYWLEDSFLSNVNSWDGIKDNVNKLRACLYPFDNGSVTNVSGPYTPSDPGINQLITDDFTPYNQLVRNLTPPPTLRLFFGDMYKNIPCILTNLQIEYKGPWNDNSLAAVARRIAAQTQSRYSNALKQNANIDLGNQNIDPAARIANLIPTNWGVKGYLLDALQTAITSDTIFPLETKVNITLETMYPFGTQYTYQNVRKYPVYTKDAGVSKSKIISVGNTGITDFTNGSTFTPAVFTFGGGATGGIGAGGGF